MKKTLYIFLILAFGLFFTGCKDDSSDPQPTPQPTTYTVAYSLSVFGGHDDLQISYFEANNVKRQKTNPKTPWEETFNNYNKIDSVAFRASFIPGANKTVNYEWSVKITQSSGLINEGGGSQTVVTEENPPPIYINWAAIIE